MDDTVLYGCIHTCDLVNYCMDWKVQYWVMYTIFAIAWTEKFTQWFTSEKSQVWIKPKTIVMLELYDSRLL